MKTPEETFYKNIAIITATENKMDYTFIDEKDVLDIKQRLAYIKELCLIYANPETITI